MSRGLSVNGSDYFSDFMAQDSTKKPNWMQFGAKIGAMVGDYRILNFITGFEGLEQFTFRTPKWPIGGMYFDGILRTEHLSRVRTTNFPVQTGVTMTDHALIEPAELTIEIMMTDTAPNNLIGNELGSFAGFGVGNILGSALGGIAGTAVSIYNQVKNMDYSNLKELGCKPSVVVQAGSGRSIQQWQALKTMQLSRVPITVETRLQNYSNMIIEELSTPDDAQTLNALKCTVRLKQIIFANVAETQVSARPASSATESAGGTVPANTSDTGTALYGMGVGNGRRQ